MPIIATVAGSQITESWLRLRFKQKAIKKIESLSALKVLAITASYGKTSIKNILYELIKDDFITHKTAGNVNTDLGIAKDINNDLPANTEIYIVEAGAREKGDILEIAMMIKPHYVIIGKVGAQHIEYFKTIENIRSAKRELLVSNRLIKGVVDESSFVKPNDEIFILKADQITNINATLDGTSWDLQIADKSYSLTTPLLGAFNATNISLAFIMALELGIDKEKLIRKIANLKPVAHRLEPIKTPTKLILDDSYNGNLDGMLQAIELAKTYSGRKVIITPGLVESDKESNTKLADEIDRVFDLVLITGDLNAEIFMKHISRNKIKRIYDKRVLEKILEEETKTGDLILFANDAPTFI